jgi:repressor LexA
MEPAQAARNGDMVAVWLKDRGEVTFKKYFHEGSRVRLQPENSSMEPIYTTPDNVEIQGKFVASFRGALA